MKLNELYELRGKIERVLKECFQGGEFKVLIDHAESPNPLCFFEVDGVIFAQGSFWSNNEFSVQAMNTLSGQEIMNQHGIFKTTEDALRCVREFCGRATS